MGLKEKKRVKLNLRIEAYLRNLIAVLIKKTEIGVFRRKICQYKNK